MADVRYKVYFTDWDGQVEYRSFVNENLAIGFAKKAYNAWPTPDKEVKIVKEEEIPFK